MDGSRTSSLAPWAPASIVAAGAVQSGRFLATHEDLPVFWQALGYGGLALSAFVFGRMLFKRLAGDKNWGAPPYTSTQANLIFWCSSFVAIGGAALWLWRGS